MVISCLYLFAVTHVGCYTSSMLKDTLVLSQHAKKQQRRRGLADSDLHLVLEYGREIRQAGRSAFFMTAASAGLARDHAALRLIGMAVVISDEGVVITAFRAGTTKGLRKWREHSPKEIHQSSAHYGS